MGQTRRLVTIFLMVSKSFSCIMWRSLSCWWCITGNDGAFGCFFIIFHSNLFCRNYIKLTFLMSCIDESGSIARKLLTIFLQRRGRKLSSVLLNLMLLLLTSLLVCAARRTNKHLWFTILYNAKMLCPVMQDYLCFQDVNYQIISIHRCGLIYVRFYLAFTSCVCKCWIMRSSKFMLWMHLICDLEFSKPPIMNPCSDEMK